MHKMIVIGGSAGSLEVLLPVIESIKALPVPVIIVLHRREDNDNLLVELLNSRTALPVKEAEDKEPITPGTIYIAPADYHLLIETDHSFSLDSSERVNFSRPSIDVSLETAADAYGKNLVAILLSGGNNDGAEGLKQVKKMEGMVIIQDPNSASVAFMPQNAILEVEPDYIITAAELAGFINTLLKNSNLDF